MAANLKTILVSTAIGTGVVGSSAGAIYLLQNNQETKETKSIKKQLEKDKKKLLVNGTQDLWNIKLSTYNKLKTSNTKIKLTTEENWSNLKTWCEQQVDFNFNEENKKLYEGIKEVCTVPSNKEKLASANKELAKDSQHWESRKTEYQAGDNNNPIPKINKDDSDLINKLEKWCKEKIKEEFTAEGQGSYSSVLKWCTTTGK